VTPPEAALRPQGQLSEHQLTFARAKQRDLLASCLYRLGRLGYRRFGPRALAFELRLERIIRRLTFEHAGALYGDAFHNAVMALPAAPLADWVPPGSRVLDIGCGTGRVARLLAPHAAEVLGVDRNPRAIGLARQRTTAGNVRYELAEATQPLPTGYDVSVLSHVIEHIEPVDELLSQLRALSSRLLVEVPQFGTDALNVVRHYQGMDFSSDADHVREYTRELLEAQLARNGWRVADWVERPIALAALALPA
jgi:2-polyprenyl-3-methyl-5-hydroxy-6-metoxy-1,4-benzoquinol methylase